MYSYELEKEWREKGKYLAKHIKALLKVGKANAMSREDIELQLECHGLKFEEHNFRDAFSYLDDDVKTTDKYLYYIRKSGESQRGYWY